MTFEKLELGDYSIFNLQPRSGSIGCSFFFHGKKKKKKFHRGNLFALDDAHHAVEMWVCNQGLNFYLLDSKSYVNHLENDLQKRQLCM